MASSKQYLAGMQISPGATADGLDQSLVGDPDCGRTTIARIIAREDPRSSNTSGEKKFQPKRGKRYLVKWQGLPYDEASWEWEDELRAFAGADCEKAVADLKARQPIACKEATKRAKVHLFPVNSDSADLSQSSGFRQNVSMLNKTCRRR